MVDDDLLTKYPTRLNIRGNVLESTWAEEVINQFRVKITV